MALKTVTVNLTLEFSVEDQTAEAYLVTPVGSVQPGFVADMFDIFCDFDTALERINCLTRRDVQKLLTAELQDTP